MINVIADCAGKTLTFRLLPEVPEITAGSMPENFICLPFKGVSRRHFALVRRSPGWLLRDLGSRNGTFVNGKKVNETPIRPGDKISAGIVQMQVHEAPEDLDTILLTESDTAETAKPDTDEMTADSTTKAKAGNVFHFPKLVFPEGMIPGRSPVMFDLFQKIHSITDSDVSVLLVGETGVGKEMIARTLHLSGKRAGGPFVAVNCAAIPADLAESELFGIGERVATNVGKRSGLMVQADGGTLFLDELSAFPVALQPKILRAIEDRRIHPVGEKTPVKADFRVVSTSNEDPRTLIEQERLRKDLYHRLAAVELVVPPLRGRPEDIESIVIGVLRQLTKQETKRIAGVKAALMTELQRYTYPGNVRELVNILKAMFALARAGDVLTPDLLPERVLKANREPRGAGAPSTDLRSALNETTRKLILEALQLHQGNFTNAAKQLRITPRGLRKMMHRLGM
jgi:two-component system response regulator HydG